VVVVVVVVVVVAVALAVVVLVVVAAVLVIVVVSVRAYVGPCHHGMARPQVADRGTASYMEGSCE
jgi:hypothetical protein